MLTTQTSSRLKQGLLFMAISTATSTLWANDNDWMLEEIIVTAEKRSEGASVADTPLAISAVGGAELEARGYTSLFEAISVNPGVSSSKVGGQGESVQIRGISSTIGDSPVGYYLDDMPFTRVGQNVSPELNPYDLNRVEVLRGPQGTLYGSGSSGGTVRIITQDPYLNEFSGKTTVATSFTESGGNNWKVQGAVNIPLLEDTLALRVVGSQIEQAGYIDRPLEGIDNFNDMEDSSYRAKLLYTPTEKLSIKASVWHTENSQPAPFADEELNYSAVFFELDPVTFMPSGSVRPAEAAFSSTENESDLYGVSVEYVSDNFVFVSTTSYLEGDSVQGYDSLGTPFVLQNTSESFSQEFRVSTSLEGRLNWTAGLMYQDMETTAASDAGFVFQGVPTISMTEFTNGTSSSQQWALYGELHYQLANTWTMTLGARYFEDEREARDEGPSAPFLGLFGIANPRKDTFEKPTGRLNLAWTPDEDSLYYLNVAQGFRSGYMNLGYSIVSGAGVGVVVPEVADEELVTSYELGAKVSFLEGDLSLEAVAYYLEWDDIQTFVTFIDAQGAPGTYGENAASAEGTGFELGLVYRGIEGLILSMSGNINETEYQDDGAGTGTQKGDQVSMAPEATLSASAAYRWQLGDMMASAFLNAVYTDERTDYALFSSFTSDATTVINARIGIELNDQTGVFLTVENLSNEDGALSQLAVFDGYGVPAVRLKPRTVGVEVNYNF
ncbi:TonB-dependent receptor [Pseudomaricurvus alkylphenolicus]|uniref:TonB-dependent receptor n=1 Tax=Pseudomaricurvus alkylphenolicus TaxID=1306991 RepID=UPI00141FFC70|nr:TonB-dependent receptor [Pseudomaricurvus alkylphenolicus]NIB38180.1 TonB-dependent receptor [Pseudomaricurvus alkylphenolicus]